MTSPGQHSKRFIDSVADHPWRAVVAAVAVALAALFVLWDWNWFRGPLERQVEARTGRSLDIDGNLDVALGRITTVRADAVSFGNAEWAADPAMASADRIELQVEALPLLFAGELRLREVRLARPRLRLETGPNDTANWQLRRSGRDRPLQLRRLWIDRGSVRYVDAAKDTHLLLGVASTRRGRSAMKAPIVAIGGGRWRGNGITFEGRAESPLQLRDKDTPYLIDARAESGNTRAHARGALIHPFRLREFQLQLALSGKDLADLYPLFGLALPDSRPYSLDGRLARSLDGDRATWRYDNLSGTVGRTDLAGAVSVTTGGPRPRLQADLVSRRLDLDDLAGFLGAASGNASTAPAAGPRGRLLPHAPYELDKLRAMDADVRWKARRIVAPRLPLDDMDAHLRLESGLLRLDPLDFGVAGGMVRSRIRMDARKSTIRTSARISGRSLDLRRLFPDARLARDAVGKVGGEVDLAGQGNSIAAMLASADGDLALGMGRGRISNLLMELAGLDVYESLKFLIGRDRQVPIRCAFGDFAVRGGVMTARALAFDTTDTIIIGEGQVDLRDESFQLRLRPRPKDRSLLSLRSPLVLTGTFMEPEFRPDYARVGLRGALALALGSIAPPAALIATLELGPGEDSNCGGRYAK
jgi:AsmA family protein